MQERAWLAHYPEGIPAEIDLSRYTSLVALMEQAFAQHAGGWRLTLWART